jgi:hypothetical protein
MHLLELARLSRRISAVCLEHGMFQGEGRRVLHSCVARSRNDHLTEVAILFS